MARYYYCGYARDGNGNILSGATITLYLTDRVTVATFYGTLAGGVVTSVASDSAGFFELYVDDTDYYQSQKFALGLSKTGYTTKIVDIIKIFPVLPVTIVAALPADASGADGDILIYESGALHYWLWKAGGKWYYASGTAVT